MSCSKECVCRSNYANFVTGCALTQTTRSGRIITGPITYETDLFGLTLKAYPENADIKFTNATGTELTDIQPGDTFYISVPETTDTFLVTVIAYFDYCFYTANAAPNEDLVLMLARSNSVESMIDLPDCYLVYAELNFYVNPIPVNSMAPCDCGCGRRRNNWFSPVWRPWGNSYDKRLDCIHIAGARAGAAECFYVPCCRT